MSNDIVQITVSQTSAPIPNTLQKTGALISVGGTNTPAQTLTLLQSLSNLTAILAAAVPISTLTWSGGIVTATTVLPHGWTTGDMVLATIAGAVPNGYNAPHKQITVTGASTFTYAVTSNPGTETTPGTVTLYDESELLTMGTTYFAQPAQQAVYVLELGEGTVAEAITALTTFMTNNPGMIYTYLVPREWDGVSSFLSFIANYNAPNAKTYFFVTTSVANETIYMGNKCVLAQVEAPSIPATEFTLAADLAVTLGYSPNSTQRVTSLSYAFVYGVTPYPQQGNQAVLATLETDNVGYIATGAEGGLPSNLIIKYGYMSDGNPFNYWYAADWTQINVKLNLANEIINGSNNPLAPLQYNQAGINRLQARAVQTMQQAITNGLVQGIVTTYQLPAATFAANYYAGLYVGELPINAEPFLTYSAENPSDYSIGQYNGISMVVTPLIGFKHVGVLISITNIIVPS
jgi:hypothetical protein